MQIYQILMDFLPTIAISPLQQLNDPWLEQFGVTLLIKRDDLLHPQVSGNKWRKLKYNLLAAQEQGYRRLLTFGGAYSNHLYATAAAGKLFGFETIGIVRGDEHSPTSNPTLRFCADCGMELVFVSRTDYRQPDELTKRYGEGCYVLPEGGTNTLAYKGLSELMDEIYTQISPDYVCVPVGTGGTVTGICRAARGLTKVLGFSVLKDGNGFSLAHIQCLVGTQLQDWDLILEASQSPRGIWVGDYHCGGYAKTTPELLAFIRSFEAQHGILLEQVYTGKMLLGLYDMIRKGIFKHGSAIVAVHTGGLQGRKLE